MARLARGHPPDRRHFPKWSVLLAEIFNQTTGSQQKRDEQRSRILRQSPAILLFPMSLRCLS